jgi:MYXO-CTERM domain-containing protein
VKLRSKWISAACRIEIARSPRQFKLVSRLSLSRAPRSLTPQEINMSSRSIRWACVLLLTPALAAQAQVVNGGFEAGLAGWATLGDASTQAGAPLGAQQLWLTTASKLYQDDFPLAAGALNRSGTGAADVGVSGGVESFVGGLGIYAYEGSAARQTVMALAGDTLSFRWDMGTSDMQGDIAFVVIDGALSVLATSNQATLPGTLGNTGQTGFSTFTHTFTAGGTHSLAFGVVDVGDYAMTSTLAIDGVQIGDVSVVPEGSGGMLGLASLAMLAAWTRRRA